MDIAAGLSLLSTATKIAKDMNDIDKDFDIAILKSRMAELYGALSDVKIAFSDARDTIHDRDQTIKQLQDRIDALTSGESCPICQTGRMKIESSKADPHFGVFGVQQRTLKCTNCDHTEKRQFDPRKDR